MILGYQLSRLVRVLAIALTGWPLPRLSAQTNRLDVLLVGGRVMVLAVALALIAQAAAAHRRSSTRTSICGTARSRCGPMRSS